MKNPPVTIMQADFLSRQAEAVFIVEAIEGGE